MTQELYRRKDRSKVLKIKIVVHIFYDRRLWRIIGIITKEN